MKKYILIFAMLIICGAAKQATTTISKNLSNKMKLTTKQQKTIKGVLVNKATLTRTSEDYDRQDSVYRYKAKYIELTLDKMAGKEDYYATKKLEDDIDNLKSVTLVVIISKEVPGAKHFRSTTEFLNYMYDCGYEKSNKDDMRTHINYTFKRIN